MNLIRDSFLAGGILKSLGTNGTSLVLNSHFHQDDSAGGIFLKDRGGFWRWISIWRRIPGADFNMEVDFGGGLNMEADSRGGFQYGGGFGWQIPVWRRIPGAAFNMEADFGGD
jgi:hypothetical protein